MRWNCWKLSPIAVWSVENSVEKLRFALKTRVWVFNAHKILLILKVDKKYSGGFFGRNFRAGRKTAEMRAVCFFGSGVFRRTKTLIFAQKFLKNRASKLFRYAFLYCYASAWIGYLEVRNFIALSMESLEFPQSASARNFCNQTCCKNASRPHKGSLNTPMQALNMHRRE